MKLLLLVAYLFFGAQAEHVIEVEVEAKEAELMQALPEAAPQAAGIEIEVDAEGKLSATSKDGKLAPFLPKKEDGMKPLNDWLAGLEEGDPVRATLKIDGDARQAVLIKLLNSLAKQGITEVVIKEK